MSQRLDVGVERRGSADNSSSRPGHLLAIAPLGIALRGVANQDSLRKGRVPPGQASAGGRCCWQHTVVRCCRCRGDRIVAALTIEVASYAKTTLWGPRSRAVAIMWAIFVLGIYGTRAVVDALAGEWGTAVGDVGMIALLLPVSAVVLRVSLQFRASDIRVRNLLTKSFKYEEVERFELAEKQGFSPATQCVLVCRDGRRVKVNALDIPLWESLRLAATKSEVAAKQWTKNLNRANQLLIVYQERWRGDEARDHDECGEKNDAVQFGPGICDGTMRTRPSGQE